MMPQSKGDNSMEQFNSFCRKTLTSAHCHCRMARVETICIGWFVCEGSNTDWTTVLLKQQRILALNVVYTHWPWQTMIPSDERFSWRGTIGRSYYIPSVANAKIIIIIVLITKPFVSISTLQTKKEESITSCDVITKQRHCVMSCYCNITVSAV